MPNYTGFLLLDEAMFRTDQHRLTNLDTNVSVYLGVCKLLSSPSEDIGHSQILSLVLAVLSQAFPCHHDRHRRLGNKVVTERAKQHTAIVSQCTRIRVHEKSDDLPFESVAASRTENDQGRFKHVDLAVS